MTALGDGPPSSLFSPLTLTGDRPPIASADSALSPEMAAALDAAPLGDRISWGIPFHIRDLILIQDEPLTLDVDPIQAAWLVFTHTSDLRPIDPGPSGFYAPMRGEGQLGETAAHYTVGYANGSEISIPIRRRFQLGTFRRRWGENCFEAVAHHKPHPCRAAHEQLNPAWGWTQTRVQAADSGPWINWLWAWQNPRPDIPICGFRFEPAAGTVVLSAVSAGQTSTNPLRWAPRRKVVFTLPPGTPFDPELDQDGLLSQFQLDLGQVISAAPRLRYPDQDWPATHNNQLPQASERQVLVEYTAHPQASFHTPNGGLIPVKALAGGDAASLSGSDFALHPVRPADQRVNLRVLDAASRKPVPVKLHIHGAAGEYLPPADRHRIPNPAWFEDFSTDFVHGGDWDGSLTTPHFCTYIPGETRLDLPLGEVYIEVSKGFEIRPLRQVLEIKPDTTEITLEVEKVLPWREQGWVTADTHVHFLSPMTALLEGQAEGVNVVNLLASQWGELMTNVGDFDGTTTWGSPEAGGDGEYLVRVGTENRQHVLGHISLLGYSGRIIAPMTTGGPDESALGDPIEILLTEWARQCRRQGGLTVLPHFPQPRAENAASLVSGDIDAVEMTSWGNLYGGIDPYSLSDWYRYLNCGYLVAAVGGTDKMSANTPVGAVRTYARMAPDQPFNYENWMGAVRRAETFVTYGPLLDFRVEGHPMGSQIEMPPGGGTVDITWQAASVTIPMSRVELVVNGEIRESQALSPESGAGNWSFRVEASSWLALLVRGHYHGKPEVIAAHSSPVMVKVAGSPLLAAADALTILEQIEGALAYLDTVGTRADTAAYKRQRLVLTAAHRGLHNRLHQLGTYHEHSPLTDHPEHHPDKE